MKRNLSIIALFIGFSFLLNAQEFTHQKIATDPDLGVTQEYIISDKPSEINSEFNSGGNSREPEINWQVNEAAAIGSKIVVSGASGYTFNSWWLNDERVALYDDSPAPIWDYPIPVEWEYPIDMTPDGVYMATGYDSVFQVFSSASQSLVWEKITNASIIGKTQ